MIIKILFTIVKEMPIFWKIFLKEKITRFDLEKIPERIVHTRGSGAHGFFEL